MPILDWLNGRGSIKADKFIYTQLDNDKRSILEVAAIAGHDHIVRELRARCSAKASKFLFATPTYDALTEAVKNELKSVGSALF